MSDYYCLGCLKVIDEGDRIEYREDDVNWSEMRCPCGCSELEEFNWDFALSTVRWALTLAKQFYSKNPYIRMRLEHTLDFLEDNAPLESRVSDLLRPCDCESGFCNNLPNPFEGHICRQDTIEMAEELTKAADRIEELEQQIKESCDEDRSMIRERGFGGCPLASDLHRRIEALERAKAAATRLAVSMTARYAALIESKACPVCNAEAAKWAEQSE